MRVPPTGRASKQAIACVCLHLHLYGMRNKLSTFCRVNGGKTRPQRGPRVCSTIVPRRMSMGIMCVRAFSHEQSCVFSRSLLSRSNSNPDPHNGRSQWFAALKDSHRNVCLVRVTQQEKQRRKRKHRKRGPRQQRPAPYHLATSTTTTKITLYASIPFVLGMPAFASADIAVRNATPVACSGTEKRYQQEAAAPGIRQRAGNASKGQVIWRGGEQVGEGREWKP